jgi:hypothetical protein
MTSTGSLRRRMCRRSRFMRCPGAAG